MKKHVNPDIITGIQDIIENFEKLKSSEQKTGVVYTPKKIANYMVDNLFRMYFEDKKISINSGKNKEKRLKLLKKLNNIKVIDPSCGSGRFLLPIADYLLNIYKSCEPDQKEYELKKKILHDNIYGVELEKESFTISKLKLLSWLFSSKSGSLDDEIFEIENYSSENLDKLIDKLNIHLNIYNSEFLLEFNEDIHFDIIIGNPPYVENKKITDLDLKKKLKQNFQSAYKLFDLSILFIEKALSILNKGGFLSFLLPNKFLAADYGIKIRELLVNKTSLKEIMNISSLPVFNKTAAYPIIMSLKNSASREENLISMKKFSTMEDIYSSSEKELSFLPQSLVKRLPANVIPISGNFNLITYLYTHFKPLKEIFEDIKIVYRPFGFLNWSKHFENIEKNKVSDKDLLVIGTGNVGKYYIKFDKRIKIAKKDIEVSYFKYRPKFEDIWSTLSNEKLLFREIAKELTWVYDPGIFTNITGLYFLSIPSLDTDKLFCLLTILNSDLMNEVFTTLFGTLHMSGGYLRFNGSFIKRLPMPKNYPLSLSRLGKIMQFLAQLKYDLPGMKEPSLPDVIQSQKIDLYMSFFRELTNSLIHVLFMNKTPENSNNDLESLKKLLNSEEDLPDIDFKYPKSRFNLPKFKYSNIEDLKNALTEVDRTFSKLQC